MKKLSSISALLAVLLSISISPLVAAQEGPTGLWKSIDDKPVNRNP